MTPNADHEKNQGANKAKAWIVAKKATVAQLKGGLDLGDDNNSRDTILSSATQ
jgi:hypothetical protein